MDIGHYNKNSQSNATYVKYGPVTIYYSYKSIVAIRYSEGLFVIKNQRSSTTGKHLNWIDGGNKKDRLDPPEFVIQLGKGLAEMGNRLRAAFS